MTDEPKRREISPTTASRLVVRSGAILMCRRGPVKMVVQARGFAAERAPEPRGLWAFPWPYYDEFFAHHKWDEVLPKHLTRAAIKARLEPLWEADRTDALETADRLESERQAWIKANGAVQPIRRFWWEGDVYARFGSVGQIDLAAWFLLPAGIYAGVARRVEPRGYFSSDHMEVFLAPGRGRIRSGDLGARPGGR